MLKENIHKSKINEILNASVYDEIKNRKDILFLTFGGSYAYGTNHENSDIDIRGVVENTTDDILLSTGRCFQEQFENSDTVLYGFKKFFELCLECNPNVIEMLGCDKEDYAMISEEGQMLLDNKHLFLSKEAYNSFGKYARAQLTRLKNSLVTDAISLCEKQFYMRETIDRMLNHFEKQFSTFKRDMIKYHIYDYNGNELTIDNLGIIKIENIVINKESLNPYYLKDGIMIPINLNNTDFRIDVNMENINPKEFKSLYVEISSFMRDYDKYIGHRNRKKDEYHVNKHASHLVRLFYMAIIILEEGTVRTKLKGEHLDMCKSISRGDFMLPNGQYKKEFFDYVDCLNEKLEIAYSKSKLPDSPNMEELNKLQRKINLRTLQKNHIF